MKCNLKPITLKHSIIILIFLAGFIFTLNVYNKREGFTGKKSDCYDMLIKDGKHFLLFKKNKARIPGINPVVLNNLEEYVEFLEWQRSQGIKCPVLFYQKSYDSQNNATIKEIADPLRGNENAGLNYPLPTTPLEDASRESPFYNRNLYPGFDPYNQTIGLNTPLDKMFRSKEVVSDNPADTNWGGVRHTEEAIKRGDYDDRIRFEKMPQSFYLLQQRSIEERNLFNKQQQRMNELLNNHLKIQGHESNNYESTIKHSNKPMSGIHNKGKPSQYSGKDGLYNTRDEYGIEKYK